MLAKHHLLHKEMDSPGQVYNQQIQLEYLMNLTIYFFYYIFLKYFTFLNSSHGKKMTLLQIHHHEREKLKNFL